VNKSILPIESLLDAEDASLDMCHYKVCMEMADICTKMNGIGLSAVQVGIPLRLFVVRVDDSYEFYLNCTYEAVHTEHMFTDAEADLGPMLTDSLEGCLSIKKPDGSFRYFMLRRYKEIYLKGHQLTDDGIVPVNRKVRGIHAIVFQHEIDHQRGTSIMDIGEEIDIKYPIA